MNDDVMTRNTDGELAVRVVSATEQATVVNPNDVYTRDTDGNLAIRTVGSGGGSDPHNLGWFATQSALETAYPTAEDGDWAIVGSTDTVWIWDSDTNAWKDSDQKGQVVSVNNKTGTVVLNALDVGAVPQYTTMPVASSANADEICQFIGTTDTTYTNGYFYKCVSVSASATATSSNPDVTVSVDVQTFAEQVSESGQYVFEYDAGTDAWYDSDNNPVVLADFGISKFGISISQDTITVDYVAESYGWQRTDVQPAGSAVTSVNGQTGDVVVQETLVSGTNIKTVNGNSILGSGNLSIEGGLPQYDTMPTASALTVGKIVQYTGTTTGNYTHGYIYEGVGGGQPASATVTQTVGENLSNLAIDLETFEEHEEPTGNETLTFQYVEYDEYPQGTIQQGWTGGFTIDPTDFSESILTELGWDLDFDLGDAVTVSLEKTGNNEYTLTLSMTGQQTQTYTGLEGIDLGDYGITVNGNPSVGQTCIKTIEHVWGEEWRLDGISVDVADYGITYTGTPEDGNEIQVVYTAASGSAYTWQQINVQPESIPVTPSTMPTLAVADWSSNTQTVTVSGVTSSNVVFVAPAPASAADYAAAGIICTAQGTDSLTFTCDTVPSNDIVVNVVIFG